MNAAIFQKKEQKTNEIQRQQQKKTIFIAAVGCVTEADRKTAPFFFGFIFLLLSVVVRCFSNVFLLLFNILISWHSPSPSPIDPAIEKSAESLFEGGAKAEKGTFFFVGLGHRRKKSEKKMR